MRKLFKLLIPLLCFLPLFISAGTFEDGRKLANKYMEENFEDDYSRYIVSEDSKYGFSEKGIFNVSGFNKGGLINKYEYDLSKASESVNDSSWLYDVNGYWTLTGDNNNAYVVGKTTYPKTNVFNNRLVEYVRNKTRVTGKGTYSNPWVIDKSYQVIIKANRENLVNSIYYNKNKCGEDRCETNILMNRDAIFYINFKDGYEFDASEGGANLCNASSYTASSGKLVIPNVMDDIKCFFKVKEKEYKITFDANGGTLTGESSKDVAYTKSYGTLPEPTREGYGFAGWYTEKYNGNRIDSSSILDTPEAKTLYAHWEAKSYTVTFDGNGGTPSYTNKTVVYDSNYGSLPTANRSGYTFLGWYTAASEGTQVKSETKVAIKNTQTLYAHWKANTYTVTFAKNDGSSNSAGTRTVTYDAKYGSLPTVSRTGYTFVGWFTAASGGTQITKDTTVKITEAQTLYAHWTPNKYIVTFIKNDGTSNNAGTRTVTYDAKYGTLPTVSRSGYTFLGWYTAASGGTQVTSATKVTQAKDHTLYAQWKADRITCPELTYKCSNTSKGSNYKLTYNGKCEVTCENENWKVKFLTSGTLTTTVSLNVDVFLVGGGGGGYTTDYSVGGAGGGGYTKTVKNITLQPNTYKIDVGAGGGGGQNGKSSTVKLNNAIINGLSAAGGKTGTIKSGCCGYCSFGGAGGNTGGGFSDCNQGTPLFPTTFGGGQGSTTCEFGEGTTTGCNPGVKQYSGGGCCGCCFTPSAGGGACSGGSGQANTGGGGGAYYLNVGSGGSGIVIIRNKR